MISYSISTNENAFSVQLSEWMDEKCAISQVRRSYAAWNIQVSSSELMDFLENLLGSEYAYKNGYYTWVDPHRYVFIGGVPSTYKIRDVKRTVGLEVGIYGTPEYIEEVMEKTGTFAESRLISNNLTAKWYYQTNNGFDQTTVDLTEDEHFYPEFYPFIGDVDKYFEDFAVSKERILVLTGDPGLGKTSLIRFMLKKMNWSARITYDEAVMRSDPFYLSFASGSDDVLIIEDADLLLEGRLEAGNRIMSKLLNVSDGLVGLGNKKFIFTANLRSINDIDEALIRPGRCFDVLQFRPLNFEEATVAAKSIGVDDLPDDRKHYTIAEIFNAKKTAKKVVPFRKVGFLS